MFPGTIESLCYTFKVKLNSESDGSNYPVKGDDALAGISLYLPSNDLTSEVLSVGVTYKYVSFILSRFKNGNQRGRYTLNFLNWLPQATKLDNIICCFKLAKLSL